MATQREITRGVFWGLWQFTASAVALWLAFLLVFRGIPAVWDAAVNAPSPRPFTPLPTPRTTAQLQEEVTTLESERLQLSTAMDDHRRALAAAKRIRTNARIAAIRDAEDLLREAEARFAEVDARLTTVRAELEKR